MSGPAIRAAATGATAVFNVEGGDGRLPPAAGDSADGTVTVGRKASLVLTVRVEGKAAHAASPLDGASAIDALALKIVRLALQGRSALGILSPPCCCKELPAPPTPHLRPSSWVG